MVLCRKNLPTKSSRLNTRLKLADDTYTILEAVANKTTGMVADRQSVRGPHGGHVNDTFRVGRLHRLRQLPEMFQSIFVWYNMVAMYFR
jgi:hypothetical protein